jgi:CheY-like chemotaxis protein
MTGTGLKLISIICGSLFDTLHFSKIPPSRYVKSLPKAILKAFYKLHHKSLRFPAIHMMNILIVEDSPGMRRMIRSLVEPFAAEVFECADGDAALSAYRKHHPDWVLMDIRLKESDGIAATRQICAADPQARVVIVTNYDDINLRAAATEAGARAYVLKDNLYTLPSILNRQTKE